MNINQGAAKLSAFTLSACILAACSGTGSSLPSTSSAGLGHTGGAGMQSILQTVPRAAVGSDGRVMVFFYPRGTELGGHVHNPQIYTGTSSPSGTSNLLYNGGLVQTAPKIYLTFWGSAWNGSGDPDHEKTYYTNFISGVGGSSWLSTVTQYTQSGGAHVGNAAGSYGGSWIDTAAIPGLNRSNYQTYFAQEAARAAAHFGDYGASASYVILVPHGVRVYQFAGNSSSPNAYCAWHSTAAASGKTVAYTNFPYQPDAGYSCGAGSVNTPGTLDGVSIVGGHEQAETETDPQLNAWYDSSGNEIGDKCAWTGLQNTSFSTGTFPTQPLWSNAISGCTQ